jgi:hypothetical protein
MVMIIKYYLLLLRTRGESSKEYPLIIELNLLKLVQLEVLVKNHPLLIIKTG